MRYFVQDPPLKERDKKAYEKINHPSTICRTYGAGRHIVDIPRIKFGA
jgi:hypothetical protein